jgi:hypothetical protein
LPATAIYQANVNIGKYEKKCSRLLPFIKSNCILPFTIQYSQLGEGTYRKMITLFKKNLRDSFGLYYMIAVAVTIILLIISVL